MTLKIWGRTNSANVKKALWCAEELGLAYERIDAGGVFGVVDEPAFRALNANGLVPVLEDGDLVLWESNTIVRYLAAKYGAGHLRLDDPATQASAEKWMDWTLGTVVRPFSDVFWGLVRTSPAERDPAKIAAGLEACNRALAIADAALAHRPWLSGDNFGIGDIPLGVIIYGWFGMEIERAELPALKAWYERLTERPAYRKTVMIPLT
ncbi:glutathione S-transferase [Rhizobium sp. YJ-22]|uniref:glutathione S-transferase family protein n=1 Tax=Rhizobium sp. YJ-22 TaxID=3037556 RepID=UPI0024126EA3|nr:glutathione S-transferase [Rhizobium sp. YJ-22]MDG3577336.1 glutathione S-transferase [Rhizobium sp. YJ-22]